MTAMGAHLKPDSTRERRLRPPTSRTPEVEEAPVHMARVHDGEPPDLALVRNRSVFFPASGTPPALPREEVTVGESEPLHEREKRKPTKLLSVSQEPYPLLHLTRERSGCVHGARASVDDSVVLAARLSVLNSAVERALDEDAGRNRDMRALAGAVPREALDTCGPEPSRDTHQLYRKDCHSSVSHSGDWIPCSATRAASTMSSPTRSAYSSKWVENCDGVVMAMAPIVARTADVAVRTSAARTGSLCRWQRDPSRETWSRMSSKGSEARIAPRMRSVRPRSPSICVAASPCTASREAFRIERLGSPKRAMRFPHARKPRYGRIGAGKPRVE